MRSAFYLRMPTACFSAGSCRAKNVVRALFARADIVVNGKRPWDPQVRDDRFYFRLLTDRTLALQLRFFRNK